jgi:hypothetical protein
MSQRIPATIVNHAVIDIAATADAVWGVILEEIFEAKGAREAGDVVALEDPNVPLGGLLMRMDDGNGVADERIVHFTERDEAARRLSVRADFVSVPGGVRIYASYHAQEIPGGTRFTLDCHTSLELDVPVGSDAGAAIARETALYDEELKTRLEKVKRRLENTE